MTSGSAHELINNQTSESPSPVGTRHSYPNDTALPVSILKQRPSCDDVAADFNDNDRGATQDVVGSDVFHVHVERRVEGIAPTLSHAIDDKVAHCRLILFGEVAQHRTMIADRT